MSAFSFKRFDVEEIGTNKVIVINARRGSGKSTLVRDILHSKRSIPAGIVCSGTEESNGFYSEFIPASFIYSGFNEEVIKKLIERQKRLVKEGAKNLDTFCVLDDVAFDKSIFKLNCIRELFLNGRHYKILFILTTQFLLDLPPALRSNIDYFFCFADNNASNRKRLFDHYFGNFNKLGDFNTAFQSLTRDYSSMVLDNTCKTGNMTDTVFWYKARIHKPFKIGSSAYWKYDEKERKTKDDARRGPKSIMHHQKA